MTRPVGRLRRRLLTPVLLTGLALAAGATASAPAVQADQADPRVVTTTHHDHGKWVALTFDDGPNPPDTLALLDVLKKHHVKATFCLWGEHVQQHPEVARAIARDGHLLCNHTVRHDNLATWTPEQVRADLVENDAIIRAAVPGANVKYFRAPYGAWGQSAQVAADLGMQPLGWQSLIFDWEDRTADDLTARLIAAATPGAVILAHDGGGDRSATVEAVDRAIPVLKAQGYRFGQPEKPGKTDASA